MPHRGGYILELILKELIDVPRLQAMLDDLYKMSGLPSAIFNLQGEKLTDSGWQELCLNFYKENSETGSICSNTSRNLINRVIKGNCYVVHSCPYGITNIGSPIIVEGKPIGIITIGQFFIEEPDLELFLNHINQYDFDSDRFFEALNKIPVMTINKALYAANFTEKFAEMIAEISLANLKLRRDEKIISMTNSKLESLVEEKNEQLMQANELLRYSTSKYRFLIDNLPCTAIITNPQNNMIIYANSETARILGISDENEIIGRLFTDIFYFDEDKIAKMEEQKRHILRHGYKPLTVESFIRKSDGKIIEVETSTSIIQYDDNLYTMVLIRDNTERLEAVELQKNIEHKTRLINKIMEYDKLKTEFLANISHELRTPINIIFCSLQMLNMYAKQYATPNSSNMNRHINMMKQNSYRLIRLIDNLIDVTKIDNGSFKLSLVNANIVQIINNITMSISDYAISKGLSLDFSSNVENVTLACDPDKIERIILNLLSNSIKFTEPSGKISVTLTSDDEKLIISVKDTGIGIPIEKQQTVFERFSQLDRSLTRHHEGSGIGLSLVKSLVEMHKGNIYINSEYAGGCEIIIELPIIKLLGDSKELSEKSMVNNIERIMIEFSDIYEYNI
ncbi:MAG: sensor histidine kinase [Clostridia bacterium]|nr:sensor histidine kinase [Clostridia bacterium]